MGIRLNIEITSPMDARDHELLSGIAVMTLAIANHELAEQRFPEAFNGEGETEKALDSLVEEGLLEEVKAPCNQIVEGLICVGNAGHRGRHKLRPIPGAEPLAN